MLAINQFNLYPGVYEHYKGGLYIVRTIVTHEKINDAWVRIEDPLVCYENLEPQYDKVKGDNPTMVQKAYQRPLSEFTGNIQIGDKLYPRFKLV